MVVRVSAGTQKLLGLKELRLEAPMRSAYLMVSAGRCTFSCEYCAQGNGVKGRPDRLSRITWPEYEFSSVLEALRNPNGKVGRVCLQVNSNSLSRAASLRMVEILRATGLPVSVSVRPETIEDVVNLMDRGAERVGLAVDAVREDLFAETRGGSFRDHIDLLYRAVSQYPGKITTHAIVGIGENDSDLVDFFVRCYMRRIKVALFSFTPVRGTVMADHPQPSLARYRRIQLARILVEEDVKNARWLKFDNMGNLLPFEDMVSEAVVEQSRFTSGCPDCTRPYYNERPGHDQFNVFS